MYWLLHRQIYSPAASVVVCELEVVDEAASVVVVDAGVVVVGEVEVAAFVD